MPYIYILSKYVFSKNTILFLWKSKQKYYSSPSASIQRINICWCYHIKHNAVFDNCLSFMMESVYVFANKETKGPKWE